MTAARKKDKLKESQPLEFHHRGRRVRVERRKDGWAVLLDNTLIDRIPPYEGDDHASADLEGIAKQAVNQYLEGKTPSGF